MADNLSRLSVLPTLIAKSRTTSTDGDAVDLQPYVSNHELKAVLDQGTATGTAISVAIKIQESDTTTAGDFTDITGAAFTTFTDTASNQEIQFKTNKRYVRAVSTHGTNMTAATYNVQIIAGNRLY